MAHPSQSAATKPRLLLFPGSLRRDSHQRRLLDYLAVLLEGHCRIDLLAPDEVRLPLFNQDLERDADTMLEVMALHGRFRAADALIVASPEYNGHVAPYLKNTVDWVSRVARIDPRHAAVNPFRDKPLLLCSASTGWTGGVVGLQDARSIFAYLGCLVAGEQICVSDAEQWVQAGGFQFEPGFADYIQQALARFLALVARLQAGAAHAAAEAAHA